MSRVDPIFFQDKSIIKLIGCRVYDMARRTYNPVLELLAQDFVVFKKRSNDLKMD